MAVNGQEQAYLSRLRPVARQPGRGTASSSEQQRRPAQQAPAVAPQGVSRTHQEGSRGGGAVGGGGWVRGANKGG